MWGQPGLCHAHALLRAVPYAPVCGSLFFWLSHMLFFLTLGSHSISCTGAQGIPKYKISHSISFTTAQGIPNPNPLLYVGIPCALVLWDTLCSCEAYGMRPTYRELNEERKICDPVFSVSLPASHRCLGASLLLFRPSHVPQ